MLELLISWAQPASLVGILAMYVYWLAKLKAVHQWDEEMLSPFRLLASTFAVMAFAIPVTGGWDFFTKGVIAVVAVLLTGFVIDKMMVKRPNFYWTSLLLGLAIVGVTGSMLNHIQPDSLQRAADVPFLILTLGSLGSLFSVMYSKLKYLAVYAVLTTIGLTVVQ